MAGTLVIDTLNASSGVLASKNGMTGIAKAWVRFNGSTAAINSSFNVGSITKNTTGDYTVNFTTAMSDANYSAVAAGQGTAAPGITTNGSTTSAVRINFSVYNVGNFDMNPTCVAVFGN